jgi:hypothetical protein
MSGTEKFFFRRLTIIVSTSVVEDLIPPFFGKFEKEVICHVSGEILPEVPDQRVKR